MSYQNKTDYQSLATNARPCYSNLFMYGADGACQATIAPVPVSEQPAMFNIANPHSFAQAPIQKPLMIGKNYGDGYKKLGMYGC